MAGTASRRGERANAVGAAEADERRAGAGASSAELFAAYHGKIHRHVLSIVRDRDEADDLTQEVFLQAHRKLASLRDPDAVVAWLYRIATRLCYDRFRKWARQPTPLHLEGDVEAHARPAADGAKGPNLGQVIEQAEMSGCVRGYLDDLADDYRTVILLHDLQGLTNLEIADMLGVSLDTAKIRLHRARRKLQEQLDAHCELSCDERGVLVCEPADPSGP